MSDRIEVTFFSLNKNTKDHVMATFGIRIISMDMFLSKLKLIRKKDGTAYVAPPSEEYVDPKTGKKAYSNFFWFGQKSEEFFQKEVMKAIDSYCFKKNQINPIHQNN